MVDDGRTPDHGHPISSPCEPNGSGELKKKKKKKKSEEKDSAKTETCFLSVDQNINEPLHEKTDFCLCENKSLDQLCSNCTADQSLCFRYRDSTIPLPKSNRNFKNLAFFCDCID